MTPRKLIVFDFDGTLIESQPTFDLALEEFSTGRSLPFDAKKMAVGYVNPLKYDLGWGVTLAEQPQLLEDVNDYYTDQMIVHGRLMAPLFPHAKEVLTELSNDYDLSIVTARARSTLNVILKHHGIEGLFPHYRSLCCARDRGYSIKPAPDALECLLRDTKHDPRDVVVVGDTTSDILMANNAGVKSIAALWGAHPKEKLETAKPTVMLETIADLTEIVTDIFNQ